MAEVVGMANFKCKDFSETRRALTELERRKTVAEELGNDQLTDTTLRAIVVGFIHPVTRARTAMSHGTKTSYAVLKQNILQFVTNASPVIDKQNAMKDVDMQANAFGG